MNISPRSAVTLVTEPRKLEKAHPRYDRGGRGNKNMKKMLNFFF